MRHLLLLAVTFCVSFAAAQRAITIDDLTTRNTFAQKTVSGINWMADGKFYTSLAGNKILKHDVASGQVIDTLADGQALSPSITIEGYQLSADEMQALITTGFEGIYRRSYKANYYVYRLATKQLVPLSAGGKQSYATFSPDGTRVAFVRNNNLFVVTLATMSELQVTNDGRFNHILNGSTDWVYEEELSFAQAFYWSPDSKKIAFHRFDESEVKEYNMQKWNKAALYPQDYRYKYPKAGEDNSKVEIWIYHLATQQKVKADTGIETDIYLPRVLWTANPDVLSVRRMNRLQNTLDILHVDATTGNSNTVLTEKSTTYFDIDYTDELVYLKNGKQFVTSSERNGYKHFYRYNIEGALLNQITIGAWEATQLVGMDEKAQLLYYLSTEGNYQDRTLYSISLDGKKKTKLSTTGGVHSVNMSADCQYYIDYVSSAAQPLTVSLYQSKGNKLLKVLESNEALQKTLDEYGVVPKEFFQYTAADGQTKCDGYLLKPRNFDPAKKYPVLVHQYTGPRSTNTLNNFGGGVNFYWHQMLTQQGIMIAILDTRGTGSRGEAFAKQTYKQLGKLELEDLLAGGRYLGSLPYVDKERLGIWGWSFGGYTTSLAMTKGAGVYKVGIAGAPVTTWRFYDNIYTERFLQRPQDNPGGYDDNSPLNFADKLQGDFLLIHGTGDDNVHFQNAVALEEALINAGKQFRSHFYPDQAHGFRGARVNHHRLTLMTNFLLENL